MSRRQRGMMWGLMLMLLAAPAGAEVLRIEYTPGEKRVYQDFTAVTIMRRSQNHQQGVQLKARSKVEQTVRSAGTDGAVIEIQHLENQVETIPQGGRATTSSDKPDGERVRVGPRGRILSRETLGDKKEEEEGLEAMSVLQRALDGIELPEGNLDPGGIWTQSYDVALTDETNPPTTTVNLKGTYLRRVKLDGHECAELDIEFTASLTQNKPGQMTGLSYTSAGHLMGSVTMYLDLDRKISIAELATLGTHLELTLSSDGVTVKVEETLKMNTKSSLVE